MADQDKIFDEYTRDITTVLTDISQKFMNITNAGESLSENLAETGLTIIDVYKGMKSLSDADFMNKPEIIVKLGQEILNLDTQLSKVVDNDEYVGFNEAINEIHQDIILLGTSFDKFNTDLNEATDKIFGGVEDKINNIFSSIENTLSKIPGIGIFGLDTIIMSQFEILQQSLLGKLRNVVQGSLLSEGSESILGSIASGTFNSRLLIMGGLLAGVFVIFAKIAGAWIEIEKTAAQFREELGVSRDVSLDLTKQVYNVYFNTVRLGAEMNDIVSTSVKLQDAFGSLIIVTDKVLQMAIEWQKAFGLSEDNAAMLLDYMKNIALYSDKIAESKFYEAVMIAEEYGISSSLIMNDIASSTEQIATYGFENLANAAIDARKLSINIKESLKLVEQFDSLQESVENSARIQLLTGAKLNHITLFRLSAEGKIGELQAYVLENIAKTVNWEEKSAIERRAIAETLNQSVFDTGLMIKQTQKLQNEGKRLGQSYKEFASRIENANLSQEELADKWHDHLLEQRGTKTPWEELASFYKSDIKPLFIELGGIFGKIVVPAIKLVIWALQGAVDIVKDLFEPVVYMWNMIQTGFDFIRGNKEGAQKNLSEANAVFDRPFIEDPSKAMFDVDPQRNGSQSYISRGVSGSYGESNDITRVDDLEHNVSQSRGISGSYGESNDITKVDDLVTTNLMRDTQKVNHIVDLENDTQKVNDIVIAHNQVYETHPDDVGVYAKTRKDAEKGMDVAFGQDRDKITPKVEVINVTSDIKLDSAKVGKALTRLSLRVS